MRILSVGLVFLIVFAALAVACKPTESLSNAMPNEPAASVRPDSKPDIRESTAVYVVAEVAEERSAPSSTAKIMNRIYRGQKLTAYSTQTGWVRVTPDGFIPRWVDQQSLSANRPPTSTNINIPEEYRDRRIVRGAIPEKAGNGLSEHDVLVLWRGAKHLLTSGKCSQVDYADKSTNRPNTYFIQEGYRNIYFTEEDIE